MAKKYDVIVVGAGPAGLLAAKTAGENGLEVALLDRKSDPGQLLRACGESLVCFNEYYLGNIARYQTRDKRICFSPAGFSVKYDGPYENIYSTRLYTPNGINVAFGDYEQQKSRGDYGRVGLAFDKEALFQSLLEEAKACGVDVYPGINVEKVATTADRVTVEGSGQSFEGTYVIAADGGNSLIAEMMGFNKDRTYYFNARVLASYMSGLEFPDPHDMVVSTWVILKEGAATLFVIPRPTERERNVMLMTFTPKMDLEIAFDYFMTEAFCAPWFKNAKKMNVFYGILSCYTPIIEPYKDRVLVIGDAASCVDLENTGAMLSGCKAGHAISTAIQEKNLGLETAGISHYVNWWKEDYINVGNYVDMMKGLGVRGLLTEDEMDYYWGLIKEPMPAQWAPGGTYRGKEAARAIAKATSDILERERPEIFQKLQKARSLTATEIHAELTNINKPATGQSGWRK